MDKKWCIPRMDSSIAMRMNNLFGFQENAMPKKLGIASKYQISKGLTYKTINSHERFVCIEQQNPKSI